MVSVATVDLEPWWDGDADDRRRVAEVFDAAARDLGFAQIVGHRVPPAVVDAMVAASDAFFALPLDRKLASRPPDPSVNRGYAASGTEALSYSIGDAAPPDLFEAFNIGPDDVDEHDPFCAAERHRLFAPNIWPDEPTALRPALVDYFSHARRVALALTEVFAVALGLPDGWFGPYVDHSTTTMRTIHYERRVGESDPMPDQQRMGAHTDYGIVTVLWADQTPGLEILTPDGRWHGVVPAPGALLVNLGDLTAEWTNDRWRSTLHRVVPPSSSSSSGPAVRRSAAFFFDGNWDARIECLPTCTDADNPPRYPPVIAGEHLLAKLLGPRTMTASDALDTAADRY
jgi:isopenicillin N synthase-like dioxygenase